MTFLHPSWVLCVTMQNRVMKHVMKIHFLLRAPTSSRLVPQSLKLCQGWELLCRTTWVGRGPCTLKSTQHPPPLTLPSGGASGPHDHKDAPLAQHRAGAPRGRTSWRRGEGQRMDQTELGNENTVCQVRAEKMGNVGGTQ